MLALLDRALQDVDFGFEMEVASGTVVRQLQIVEGVIGEVEIVKVPANAEYQFLPNMSH